MRNSNIQALRNINRNPVLHLCTSVARIRHIPLLVYFRKYKFPSYQSWITLSINLLSPIWISRHIYSAISHFWTTQSYSRSIAHPSTRPVQYMYSIFSVTQTLCHREHCSTSSRCRSTPIVFARQIPHILSHS